MIVVDTNVTTCLWLRGEFAAAAERWLRDDPVWAVAVLWRSEFRNVLAGFVKRKVCTLQHAIWIARQAEEQFNGREFAPDSEAVLRLSNASGCTAYDCEFVALARMLGVRLVTNDRGILRSFAGIAVPLESHQ